MEQILLPSLAHRVNEPEMMDDFSVGGEQVERALEELCRTNRVLGGYRAARRELAGVLRARRGGRLTVLDLGTGAADYPEHFVSWGRGAGVDVRVTALDANPVCVAYARRRLDQRLSSDLRRRVRVVEGDALDLPYGPGAFDVVTTSLFLHHLSDEDGVRFLRRTARVAAAGILVNDLHRHVAAYLGIRAITRLLPVSEPFRNDGPLSVRRAYRPRELAGLAHSAGLESFRIRRYWAFRLTLSTIQIRTGR